MKLVRTDSCHFLNKKTALHKIKAVFHSSVMNGEMSQDRDLNPGPMRYECIALPTELSWLNLKQEEYTGNKSFFQAELSLPHGVWRVSS